MKHLAIALLGFALLFLSACDQQTPLSDEAAAPKLDGEAAASSARQAGSHGTAADQYVIEFNGSASALEAAVEAQGGTLAFAHEGAGVATATGIDDPKALKRARGVKRVTQDLTVQWVPGDLEVEVVSEEVALAETHKPPQTALFYSDQYNMRQIEADEAWAVEQGDEEVIVSILDTGINPTHIDMAGRVDPTLSRSMISPGTSPCPMDVESWDDYHFHGTHVAGIVSTNNIGVASVAPHVTLVAVKVLNCTGNGTFGDIIQGILYAADIGSDVINMSLGAYFPKNVPGGGPLNAALNKAVNYANGRGTLVVASAGNDSINLDRDRNYVHVPSQSGTAISISATGLEDSFAAFSNYGHSGVFNAAPGVSILSACSSSSTFLAEEYGIVCGNGSYLYVSGTSQAAPHASGVAALIDSQHGGSYNAGQLKTQLKNTADDIYKQGADPYSHHGRVNAFRAVTE